MTTEEQYQAWEPYQQVQTQIQKEVIVPAQPAETQFVVKVERTVQQTLEEAAQ